MRALVLAGITTAAVLAATPGVLAAAPEPVVIRDATADVTGPLDLQRAIVSRAPDARLRAAITFAGEVEPADLVAEQGPPGSACLRIWTAPGADPSAMRPDRLVCVTATSGHDLRASVLAQRDGGLPERVGAASVALSHSKRSLVVRVSQSALGRPRRIRIAVESTRPGCDRTSCIDTAPGGAATRTLRLR